MHAYMFDVIKERKQNSTRNEGENIGMRGGLKM